MPVSELVYKSALELGKLIRAGEVSSTEVVTAFLERIEHVNPHVNAFITVTADHALQRAKQVDRQIRNEEYLGPLHGVPYAPKDLFRDPKS